MGNIWQTILDAFHQALVVLHDVLAFTGEAAWGWAIIALTIIIRVLLLPLAIKQTRSMRAMQELQPKIKKLQSKYKVDRDLLRKDPEKYKARKAKLNEEMMALYREEGVNPAGGCLPLLAQAPIFFALFSVLRDDRFTDLQNSEFYLLTANTDGLGGMASEAGIPGILLILMMAGTMFWSQRQMLSRTNAEGTQAQQQKIMMYVMPVFLAFISFNFPLGVLLYWVTTNFWQMGQQAVILHEVAEEGPGGSAGNGASPQGRGGAPSSGNAKAPSGNGKAKDAADSQPSGKGKDRGSSADEPEPNDKPKRTDSGKKAGRPDHLPRRGGQSRS